LPITRIIVPVRRSGLTSGSTGTPINPAPGEPCRYTQNMKKTRIMYIEFKGDRLIGPARIGRVTFSKSGKSIHYKGKTFETLKGHGFKANYFDVDTGEHYWISGCRKDGMDALYSTDVEIDEDVLDEYWTKIRGVVENKHISRFRAKGKY
jgi:hypothetical protein